MEETTGTTRMYLIVPGLLLITFSIASVSRDVWWIPGFSEKFGHARVTPALTFGGLGVVFLAIGLFPWNRLNKNKKSPRR